MRRFLPISARQREKAGRLQKWGRACWGVPTDISSRFPTVPTYSTLLLRAHVRSLIKPFDARGLVVYPEEFRWKQRWGGGGGLGEEGGGGGGHATTRDIQLPHAPLVRDVCFLNTDQTRRAPHDSRVGSQADTIVSVCLSGLSDVGARDKSLSAQAPEEVNPCRSGGWGGKLGIPLWPFHPMEAT